MFYQRKFPWIYCCLIFISFIFSSKSASITTFSLATNNQLELISNSSYRYLFLRQYFLNLLNLSHSSLIQSMITNHHLIPNFEQIQNRRRREISTFHAIQCQILDHHRIQTTFHYSYPIEFLSSIELSYYLHSNQSFISIEISIKQFPTMKEFLSMNVYLTYDSIRNFYFLNLSNYFFHLNQSDLILEIILHNQTCENSHGYFFLSSKTNSISSDILPSTNQCKLKILPIQFEELGLAHLIIRPKEYSFTYCDGSCENIITQRQSSSFHTFLQSILSKKHPNIPSSHCIPSAYSDDHFLLRQTDGNLEIYPIRNAMVKQCACL